MINKICVDKNYSTTTLLAKEQPKIINNFGDKFETVLFLPKGEGRKGEGGLRTQGYFKKSYEDKPLISIVTVVFNGEEFLEETIQSVINQTYDNIEYIIIDGGSTDGTVDIIKKYEDRIDYWVSEKDRGIYDAMNKGIDVASGEWINFMNAGDRFYLKESIYMLLFQENNFFGVDVIYGDLEIDFGGFTRIESAKSLCNIYKGMVFCHQSSFIRSSYHKAHKYSLDYHIASDFDFFYTAYQKGQHFRYNRGIVSVVNVEGLSDSNRFEAISQYHKIVNNDKFIITYNIYYLYLYIDNFLRSIAKSLLPIKIINFIKKNK